MKSIWPNLKDSIIYIHYFIKERLLRITILSNHKIEYGNEVSILPGIISGDIEKSEEKFSGTVWKYIYYIKNSIFNFNELTLDHIQVMNDMYNTTITELTGITIPDQITISHEFENKIDVSDKISDTYIYVNYDSFEDDESILDRYKLNKDFKTPYQIKFVNGDNEYPENCVVVRFNEHKMQNENITKQYIKI